MIKGMIAAAMLLVANISGALADTKRAEFDMLTESNRPTRAFAFMGQKAVTNKDKLGRVTYNEISEKGQVDTVEGFSYYGNSRVAKTITRWNYANGVPIIGSKIGGWHLIEFF
jgi:hypothetical protein